MAKLPKFTLAHNDKKSSWDLKKDGTDKVVKTFPTKAEATKRGVLRKAVGTGGGSVKIKKLNDRYEEERTYPKSQDPIDSEG